MMAITAQIIMIMIMTVSFTIVAIKNGEKKFHPHDRFHLGWTLLRIIVIAFVLWMGGFWNFTN